jgi:predicted patatin/cPLA2 family phospholipase
VDVTSNVRDVALVFEGGGMRGAYTAAVVVTLLEAGIFIDFVAGISAGSSHLCNYTSRDPQRAKASFVEFAGDPQFGSWKTFAQGKGRFHAEYIYEQTAAPGQSLPFDFATFQANPARRRVGAFEADTGRAVYWTQAQLKESLPGLMRRVRASSTMPILMPPVQIGAHTYVDGALGPSGGIALDAAQQAGYRKVFAVLTRERSYVKPPSRAGVLYKTWFRRFPAVADALLARAGNYNATRDQLFELEKAGDALLFVPDQVPVSNGTTDVAALEAAYQAGLVQARRELPRWKEWLGV